MTPPQPILITGSHRSGSTWTGRTLAAARNVGYIHEPCNPAHSPGICNAAFRHWFPYICRDNEGPYLEPFRRTLSFRYSPSAEAHAVHAARDVARLARDWAVFARNRTLRSRALMKDPIAVFSAPWLSRTFDAAVVVLIRHPAAFAWSLKRLSWSFPFDHLLQQPLLMRDRLHPFAPQIEEYSVRPAGMIDQAVLLWRLIHHTIAEYRGEHPEWLFVRLEDLAAEPEIRFRALCERLGLEYGGRVARAVAQTTSASNPIEVAGASGTRRHSPASIGTWKKRLSSSEIARIRSAVESISDLFYGDSDW